jgi:SAP domain
MAENEEQQQPASPEEETGVHDAEMTNIDPLLTAAPAGSNVKEPSRRLNPSVTEEDEERMSTELTPTHVIGPPGYASPDPATEAGRLVEIEDHPLSGDIAEDYGGSVAATAEAAMSSALTSEGGTNGEGGADVEDEYSDMTVEELKAECESRGLPVSGTKAELQARLRADDAGEEQPA